MYKTTCIILKDIDAILRNYCDNFTSLAKSFKNAVIFRCRQLLFAKSKNYSNLNSNEIQVLSEFKHTEDKYKAISDTYYLPSFYHFDYMFKVMHNSDYYNDLPMQTTQAIIKECLNDFKAYFKAIKSYSKNKSLFKAKPEFPSYIKNSRTSFDITNQDAVIKDNLLKLPKIKQRLDLGLLKLSSLKEVVIKPFYDTYKVCIVTESKDSDNDFSLDYSKILGIDVGVNNFITTNNNCGLKPFIINGKIMKSYNQFYNKRVAKLKSLLPEFIYNSKMINNLSKNRFNYFNDKIHKISNYVIKYCLDNNIGTIVVGKNSSWKDKSNMICKNNQHFCYMPHSSFIAKLREKALLYHIKLIEREESYTSKASFLDKDFIYTYHKDDFNVEFSGKRVKRGLYKTKANIFMNADVNAAANIIRKEFANAFDNILDFSYMVKTVIKVNII